MADTDTPATPPAAETPKGKAKKSPKAKKVVKPSSHPTYNVMITEAITTLKERNGSSRQAIVKYIVANYKVEAKAAGVHSKMALKRGVTSGVFNQVKGAGASGSFKIAKSDDAAKKTASKKSPKKVTKKPAAKKSSSVEKKSVAKKPVVEKKKKPAPKKAKKTPVKKPKVAKKAVPKKPIAKKAAKKVAARKAKK